MTGKEFKRRRKALGLKQLQLAQELGVAPETISRWENAKWTIEPWVNLALKGLESEKGKAA